MAQYASILGTAAVAFFVVYLAKAYMLYRARARFAKENGCQPPASYPHKDPILGLDYLFNFVNAFKGLTVMDMLEKEHEKYGRTFRLNQFGSDVLSTVDPENLKSILYTDFDAWTTLARKVPMEPLIGLSILTTEGEMWKHSRLLARGPLSRSEAGNVAIIDFHLDRMLAMLPKDGSTVELKSLFDRMIQDFSTEYFFGESVDSLATNRASEMIKFEENLKSALRGMVKRLFMGPLVNILPADRGFLRACAAVHEWIDAQIFKALHRKTASTQKSDRRIFIDDVLNETTDHYAIRSNATTLFMAASETTAYNLSTAVFFLSRNKAALKKLREEVVALGPGKPNDAAALAKLPYLKAVINETLRIRHVVSILFRTALKDTILPTGGGKDGKQPIFVKKGTTIRWPLAAQLRNTSIWGNDVEEFRPERFLEQSPDVWEFLPFSGGKRICPGQTFALMNMRYTLVRLLQEFKDIESRDDRPWTEEHTLATSNKYGALVGLIPA